MIDKIKYLKDVELIGKFNLDEIFIVKEINVRK